MQTKVSNVFCVISRNLITVFLPATKSRMSMGQSDKILESEGRGIHFCLGETFVSVSKGVSEGEGSILGNFYKISIALSAQV